MQGRVEAAGQADHRPGALDVGRLLRTFWRGRKQKPKRGLSTLVPPESILAQDSVSWMYKGEWQSVLSDRAFLNVNVGRFTLDWPMVPAVDPRGAAANIPAIYRNDSSQTGSGKTLAIRPIGPVRWKISE